jgi:hypothetical protein
LYRTDKGIKTGTGNGTEGDAAFYDGGTGTGFVRRSGFGFVSGSNIKWNTRVKKRKKINIR